MRIGNILIILAVAVLLSACAAPMLTTAKLTAVKRGMSCAQVIVATGMEPDTTLIVQYKGDDSLPDSTFFGYVFSVIIYPEFAEACPAATVNDTLSFAMYTMQTGVNTYSSPGAFYQLGAPSMQYSIPQIQPAPTWHGGSSWSTPVGDPYVFFFINDSLKYWGFIHEIQREYDISIEKSSTEIRFVDENEFE